MQLPSRLQDFEIINVPIPLLEFGVKFPLKDNVCPVLIASVFVAAGNDFQFSSPSTQYSQAFLNNLAVKPSSNATMVR